MFSIVKKLACVPSYLKDRVVRKHDSNRLCVTLLCKAKDTQNRMQASTPRNLGDNTLPTLRQQTGSEKANSQIQTCTRESCVRSGWRLPVGSRKTGWRWDEGEGRIHKKLHLDTCKWFEFLEKKQRAGSNSSSESIRSCLILKICKQGLARWPSG